ncbi:hypothetical protein [Aneurinibacillus aneurinilyticus]|uniref:hypothetical protein n=1 Tax=Aneurinibacillus aneurinilyticus TaxID=1391 RepID=UPI003524FBB5
MNLNVIYDMSQPNNDHSVFNSLTFTFSYQGEIGFDNGFKLFIKKLDNTDTNDQFLFIVYPTGGVNPRAKAAEIYRTMLSIANSMHINWSTARIILDLLEVMGIEKNHLFEWKFNETNGKVHDEIKVIKDLSPGIARTMTMYYNDKFSTLIKSSLNNQQKTEIVAYALAEKCYDDFSAENIAKNFKIYLKKAIQKRKTLQAVLAKFL